MSVDSRSFRPFLRVWLGQVVSLMGSAMTQFALGIYVWQLTGEATAVVLVGVIAALPLLLTNLIAGVVVDRWNRKWILLISDLGLGSISVLLLIVLFTGELELWMIYTAAALSGICTNVQYLAFSVSIALMVDDSQYTRANGMMSLAEYLALVGAPLLAGVLLPIIGIRGILLVDTATFLFAMLALAVTHIPQPAPLEPDEDGAASGPEGHLGRLLSELAAGFRFLLKKRAFMSLLLLMFVFNAIESLGYPLLGPMILARTGNNETVLGLVFAAMGIGGIVGSVFVSMWGGTRKRIYGLLLAIGGTGLLGDVLMSTGQSLMIWIVAGFFLEAFIPLAISSENAIWQAKVPPAVQGRVFAAIGFLATLAEPAATVMGGVLADRVFEPAMQPDGWLVPVFGGIVGTGAGAGIAVLMLLGGIALVGTALIATFVPALRNLEDQAP